MTRRIFVYHKSFRFRRMQFLHNMRDAATGRRFLHRIQLNDFFAGLRSPAFIPSILGAPAGLLIDQHRLHARRAKAAIFSVFVHASVILLAILLVHKSNGALPTMGNMVMLNTPFFDLPGEDEGKAGGGGGGGGRQEQAPPAWGGLPDITRMQLLPPDPQEPQPLIPANDNVAIARSVEMPLEMTRDPNIPIGDPDVSFNNSRSSGPGQDGGIGNGEGGGINDGKGPGVGPGERGGMGGSKDGTIGQNGRGVYLPGTAGLLPPEILFDPKPEYTDIARKSRIEGSVLLQVVVRKDGSVDSFQILRSLGYGLDDAAIRTIGAKWRFRPGRLHGVPIDVPIKIEVIFHLF
jgi:TonB family protein